MRNKLFIIKCNLIFINNNFKNVFNAIFIYINKDITNNIENVKDIFKDIFNNKVYFIKNIYNITL